MELAKAAIVRGFRLLSSIFWHLSLAINGAVARVSEGFGMPFEDMFWQSLTKRKRRVVHKSNIHGDVSLDISQVNTITNWRAATFSSKEPETLEWIDSFESHWSFIDVGANVGLYSIYYLSVHKGEAFCVEPSVNNLQQLALNLRLNDMGDRATILAMALGAEPSFVNLKAATIQPGSAETSAGYLNQEVEIRYRTTSRTLDDITGALTSDFALKIDVDGLEAEILRGAKKFLRSQACKTVLIENDLALSSRRKEIEKLLASAGLVLAQESSSELMSQLEESQKTVNQVWTRAPAQKRSP